MMKPYWSSDASELGLEVGDWPKTIHIGESVLYRYSTINEYVGDMTEELMGYVYLNEIDGAVVFVYND